MGQQSRFFCFSRWLENYKTRRKKWNCDKVWNPERGPCKRYTIQYRLLQQCMTPLCYVIFYAALRFPAHAEHRFSFTSTRHCPGATDDGAESFIIDSGHGRSDRGMKLLCEFLMIGCGRTMKRSKRVVKGWGGGLLEEPSALCTAATMETNNNNI